MSFFFKLVDETQMYKPPEATRHHKPIKLVILLPLRSDLLCTLHYETPCICTRNCIKYAKMVYGNSGTSLYSLEDSDRLACHFSDPFYS